MFTSATVMYMYKDMIMVIFLDRFNVQNLNKQNRLYQQGMTPMIKTYPGRGVWERLRDRPEYKVHR